ncbi:hypothetical protein [Pseudobacteriovorax antillogorgiicola]|uniref:Uncharacterized protein n=1 Tax=Pseudobacteriovorax antillogorgiicola TaxID=1513793 RepID=A0A1Y6BUP4_9BACT|nr:hypothetical protein [Pseudobacteriovorax antillogorgiicola]TCS53791.1 hypothetical protein EDD56_107100 [Pseudobacteriovorax antillogorgiicola]SMF22200.1 hypothetical protein SAMN06296036_107172 [Pseudobacteriovorax antillogorgiicola]
MRKIFADQRGSAPLLTLSMAGLISGAVMVNQAFQVNRLLRATQHDSHQSQTQQANLSAFSILKTKICSDPQLQFNDLRFISLEPYQVSQGKLVLPIGNLHQSRDFDDMFRNPDGSEDTVNIVAEIIHNQFPDYLDLSITSAFRNAQQTTTGRIDCRNGFYRDAIKKFEGLNETFAESFQYGTPDPKVDYLFVIDNSSSTRRLISKVYDGFVRVLKDPKNFSNNSMLAVMTTGVAQLDDLGLRHKSYGSAPWLKHGLDLRQEPGFLDFVNADAIQNYRNLYPNNTQIQENYRLDGCREKWFRPYQKTANQETFCLRAALQTSLSDANAEAGITAFEQLLLKNTGHQLFRRDAMVHVIFISDTHDPGNGNRELRDNIKEYNSLRRLVRIDNQIKNLKFHAFAPRHSTDCSLGESFSDASYYKLAEDSGGLTFDICDEPDYAKLLKNLVQNANVEEPSFNLKLSPRLISKVELNGKVLDRQWYRLDGNAVIINGLDPKKAVELKISYSL